MNKKPKVLIFSATGNIGGAASREMLKRGWQVRAVTRNPKSNKALALAKLGAEVFEADMEKPKSLQPAFQGYSRVLSIQSWTTSGVDGEIRQGKLVADAAKNAGVEHLVYGSAGVGIQNSGIPHFDCKIVVEDYMRKLALPHTIIRPGPFMELLSEKQFFPALGTWGAEPRVIGWDTPSPWVAVQDIGIAVANAFADPDRWIGEDIQLYGDVKTLGQCREVFITVDGKKPFSIPIPLKIFEKMAGEEYILMWRWLADYVGRRGEQTLCQDAQESRAINPRLMDLESWLRTKRNGSKISVN